MTCDDFRRLRPDDSAWLLLTRAEQVACLAHFVTCRACHLWAHEHRGSDREPYENRLARARAIVAAALADPEARSVIEKAYRKGENP